jgi:hypothetical protein
MGFLLWFIIFGMIFIAVIKIIEMEIKAIVEIKDRNILFLLMIIIRLVIIL